MDEPGKKILRENKRSLTAALVHATNEHKNLCKENTKNRKEYLTQRVQDLNERDTKGHTTIKQIMNREENRQDYKIIRNTLKPKWSKGIRYLDVPMDEKMEDWRRVTDEYEIESILLERNKQHFKQANHTPFANTN
jgi:hypothetical protein